MIKPWDGCGNRNKAEALYLLKGHEPRHRKEPNIGMSDAYDRPLGEDVSREWAESIRRIESRFAAYPSEGFSDKAVRDEEVERFLGRVPDPGDLPDWIREAIPTEDGGLGVKERFWPSISKVKTPFDLRAYPRIYGVIYGLLRYHALTRDQDNHPQTWVSVARLSDEAGCTIQWVERTLRSLERLTFIHTETRPGKSNLYTLLLGDPGRIGQVYDLIEKTSQIYIEISGN